MESAHWLLRPIHQTSQILRRWFYVLLLLHMITAFFSYGVFHCDEHFQIIEFIGYKLGWVSASGLAWEFESQIRPWLQPFLFYLPVKGLVGLGFKDPLLLETVFRILSGLLGWVSLAVLSRSLFHFLMRTQRAFWIVFLFSSFYFLPQFHVRTSSESMSTAFLMLAFALCLKPSVSALHFAGVGFLLGLSFEARYQTAIAGVGLALWLFLSTSKKVHCAVYGTLGGLAAMLLGALADFWGYGNWVFPAYRYATVNLVEGKAASFGVSPWWDYFVTFPKKFIGPYRFLVLAGAIAAVLYPLKFIRGLRFSRPSDAEPVNRLSLALVSIILPFLVVHSMIGHKEERFLYPVVWSLWLLAILQIGLPVHQSVSKEANPYKWLRAAFYLHAALTAVLLLRGATLQLNPHRDVFAALHHESEKSPVVLRVENGENPYSLGCAGQGNCGATVVSEFLQPKNLQVICTLDDELPLNGQFYLKSYSEIPVAPIASPQGCRLHTSTLPVWGVVVTRVIPDSLSRLAFKNFRFHVLWDCP